MSPKKPSESEFFEYFTEIFNKIFILDEGGKLLDGIYITKHYEMNNINPKFYKYGNRETKGLHISKFKTFLENIDGVSFKSKIWSGLSFKNKDNDTGLCMNIVDDKYCNKRTVCVSEDGKKYCTPCGNAFNLKNIKSKRCEGVFSIDKYKNIEHEYLCLKQSKDNEEIPLATFGIAEDKIKKRFCKKCIDFITDNENIVILDNHKKCIFDDCDNRPSYNYKDKKPIYCKIHALEVNKQNHKYEGIDDINYIVDVIHDKCENVNCYIRGVFNFPNEKNGKFCKKHKEDDMVDVVSKKCEKCNIKQVNGVYNGGKYCAMCYNGDVDTKHLKEDIIKEELKKMYPEMDFQTKIQLRYEDTLIYPDIMIYNDLYNIIIEVDENQHKRDYYSKERESLRIFNIIKASEKFVYLIRINPDKYKKNNSIVNSILLEGGKIDYDELNKRLLMFKKIFNSIEKEKHYSSGEKPYKLYKICYDSKK